jgi:hypothetical protein
MFDKINKTLQAMGVSSITENEAKFLLRSLPVLAPSAIAEEKPKSVAEKQEAAVNDMATSNKMLEARVTALEKDNEILRKQVHAQNQLVSILSHIMTVV